MLAKGGPSPLEYDASRAGKKRLNEAILRAAQDLISDRDEIAISKSIFVLVRDRFSHLEKLILSKERPEAGGAGEKSDEANQEQSKSSKLSNLQSVPKEQKNLILSKQKSEAEGEGEKSDGASQERSKNSNLSNLQPVLKKQATPKLKRRARARDVCFRPLSPEEEERVNSFTRDHAEDAPVTKVNKVTLFGIQFFRLRPGKWLDDEVVNAFAALINNRNLMYRSSLQTNANTQEAVKRDGVSSTTKQLQLDGLPRPRVHMFNSFFLYKLLKSPYDYKEIRKWRRRACGGVSVFDYNLLLFPFNHDNSHWALAIIDVRRRRFCYIDSLGARETHGIIPVLRQWLNDEVRETEGTAMVEKLGIDSWKSVINPFTPRQTDGSSCGIFMLYTAYLLELGRIPTFSQADVNTLRKRTALFLKGGTLPETG